MARLTGKDYREVLNLIYLANRCVDIKSLIYTLFPPLMQVFRTECVTLQLIKGYPGYIKVTESSSFRSGSHGLVKDIYHHTLYKAYLYQHSPLLKEALSSSKIALKLGDYISTQDWERSVLYNHMIRPQHLYWELFLGLRWKNNLEGFITLWRPKNQPDYEDSDVLKAEILAPHLGVTMHNICLMSQIHNQEGLSLLADEANGDGFLWLDHKFNPSFFNAKAKDICLQLSSEMISNASNPGQGEFPVPACVTKDCSDLLELLKIEEPPGLLPKERTIVSGSGEKFRVECSLIWETNQISSAPSFMVTLSDLADESRLENALQARFKLSRRELEVTHYLTRGMSDDEIGEKLYISRQTVHTHSKNIYRKLGAKSRIELYRIITQVSYLGILNQQLG
jgi:DNA-binding CsgD family transcriptional regulator